MMRSIRLRPRRKALYKRDARDSGGVEAGVEHRASAGSDRETASVISAMTIALALVSLAFGFFAFVAVREGAWAGLVLLVVPLLLVGFVIVRIRAAMRKRRLGKSELVLEQNPTHLGEAMRAFIVVERLRPEELIGRTFNIKVTSIRRRTWTDRYHGSPTTRSESIVLWQEGADCRERAHI